MPAKGEKLALLTPPADLADIPLEYPVTKRAWFVNQITDALAISLLRDAQLFARTVKVPGMGSLKRLNWEKARELMLSSFVKLFQLDQQAGAQRDAWTKPAVVIDVPSNPASPATTEPKQGA